MTSNIGAKNVTKNAGFVNSKIENKEKIKENLEQYFRIEFINRIDEIILFSKIDKKTMKEIATKKLEELRQRLFALNINVSFEENIAKVLADECYEENYGARELIRLITNKVENSISEFILKNCSEKNDLSLIVYQENGEIITREKTTANV